MRKRTPGTAATSIDELHPARLLDLRTASRLGGAVVLYDAVGSTNEVAMSAAANNVSEGLLVVAVEQTLGKGRKGRRWHSSLGKSLTFSLLLRPARREEGLTAIFALAVVGALSRRVGGLGIRWPNDIMCRGRKLGGILAESKGGAVVMGLGLNVNESRDDFPSEIAAEAISMRMAAKRRFDRGEILCRIVGEFERLYDEYQREGFAPFRVPVERCLLYIGGTVVVESGGATYTGRMIGITNEGHLCVDIEGTERVFPSGELTVRARSRA
jgi:BirA family biotin operon repressor/biotin-[acetyl-CoA-carboxylase] ligase